MPTREEIERAYRPIPQRPRREPTGPVVLLEMEIIGGRRPGPCTASVAEIMGIGSDGDFTRNVLVGFTDYSRSNSVGSRGVYRIYFLRSGTIYEVHAPESWSRQDHYFCRIIDGRIVRMPLPDVIQCLNTR